MEQHEILINKLNSESSVNITNTYKLGKSKRKFDINISDELTELILEIYNTNNVSHLLNSLNTNNYKENISKECNLKNIKWLIIL